MISRTAYAFRRHGTTVAPALAATQRAFDGQEISSQHVLPLPKPLPWTWKELRLRLIVEAHGVARRLSAAFLTALLAAVCSSGSFAAGRGAARPFQPLHIPEAISGTKFDLRLHRSSRSFWKGATTATYAYNDETFWGPTLIFNQGDTVQINVKNDLSEPTTTHWHGLHIPAKMDGGPHQLIGAGEVWSPSFSVMNHAGSYWYHPHAHETTQKQLTYGAGGMIIIRDPVEAALSLPRTYGVDDIPLALTSRRFYKNDQFSFEGDNDKYGDYELVNGTLDPEVSLPAQFVRLRILNAEVERGYNLGFSDNRTFYVIATDGGLVEKPIPVTRMKLMVGERVEVLVNLGADPPGASVDLMAFNANHPFGFPGGEPGAGRPNGSYLNNVDFRILHINVQKATANAITKLPGTLTKNSFWSEGDVTNRRTVHITADRPGEPFTFDNKPYKMHEVSQIVKLGAVEEWTVTNNRIFGHSFHIHDVQFKIVRRSSGPVESYEQGWKDTVYVPRDESVSFIAKFEHFASETDAFMYHCHMANHEDGGLMGEFRVVNDPTSVVFRDQTEHSVTPAMMQAVDRAAGSAAAEFTGKDLDGRSLSVAGLTRKAPLVLYFIDLNCPCSRDAAACINRIYNAYRGAAQVVGIINSGDEQARAWVKAVGCGFPVIPDPAMRISRAYGAEKSVYTTLVAPGGRIEKQYPGYGQSMLTDLSQRIARLSGTPIASADFSAAPKQLTAGCSFAWSTAPQ